MIGTEAMQRVFLSLMAVVVLSVAARADDAPEAATEQAAPSVTVAPAIRSEVVARVPVSGTLVARRQVQVFSKVSGFEITELLAETGDRVEQGQVLARLDDETLTAQLAQAEAEYKRASAGVGQAKSNIDSTRASLTQAETALERARRLQSGGNTSQAALDQAIAAEANARANAASASDGLAVAQAALAQADAARRIAWLNLERADIKAPVAGLVVARNAELGALSGGSTSPLFMLIDKGEIELEAEVIETALQQLSQGDPVDVDIAGLGPVEGHVRLVPASVDPITRLGLMRISLGDKPGLRTGLFANGWVTTDRREAITVPATAVLSDASGDRVQIVADGTIETRAVSAGLLWKGRREIRTGLDVAETVVARSGAFFRDGDKVRTVMPETRSDDQGTAMGILGQATAKAMDGTELP
ncbi:efflux RND transporter periplasmic adaptor subunit [Paracoccus sp. Z330]|uniref:Efflux RND transporter periplasmic adaptor subunit n=1 Tax=Paracoccus onchidii TaxID=3017813 RepID=A0ABT4Z9G4_9RHOB|nr:efflux RND transporter periplasmic adaptor subunit [Paracoccus onchidii]MDB6175924.1 efflux RND transporter periplasmic adaptor subunit [Paracoccus onchidii]